MSRLFTSIAIAASLLGTTAFSAELLNNDYGSDLRGSYPMDWDANDNGDPLDFEFGMRYYYSIGQSNMTVSGGNYTSNDKSHILELHGRIDDNSTSTYLKAWAGYSAVIDGTYSTPGSGGTVAMTGGKIAYAGADFGYVPLGDGNFQMGGFAGYLYLSDNPDMGRSNYVTSTGGGQSDVNNVEIHMLRIGGAMSADIGDQFDIAAEAAIIPYAGMGGTYGALFIPNFVDGATTYEQGSAGAISGNLYGAAGEVMLGFHPTDNLTLRVGARASYLTGDAQMSYTAREVGTPANSQAYITNITGLEFFRYGGLLELTGSF